MDNYTLKHYLESIAERMCASFGETFRCLILYGSWAKGTAREDSDIDLLAVFEKVDSKINSLVNKVQRNTFNVKNVSIVPALVNEFYKETIPLYTSVKREGKIIWGNADLTLSNEKPTIKYAGVFSKSRVFEMNKIKIAGDTIKKYPSYGSADLCYMASKHAIQMALAMKGVGYSSKFSILLPLAEKYFGNELAKKYEKLFDLYMKSAYQKDPLSRHESNIALKYAKHIVEVYNIIEMEQDL